MSEAWKREAEDWERCVKEFGHPIAPDHAHHEVRDWLNDAFVAGVEAAIGEIDGGHFLHDKAPTRLFADEVIALLRAKFLPAKAAMVKR